MQRILVESSYAFVWREIINGLTRFIREKHAPWELHCVSSDEFFAGLVQKPAGALCLLMRENSALLNRIVKSRVPTVNMFRDVFPILPSVLSDHRQIGANAADFYLSRGFRHFAYLGPDRDWSHARAGGFVDQLRKRGHLDAQVNAQLSLTSVRVVADRATARILRRWVASLHKPVAIFAGADFIARMLLQACASAGSAVPGEVAILGVDNDVDICELAPVPISSIPQDLSRIGYEAAQLLNDLMARKPRPAAPIRIPPKDIVVRRSTNAFAFEDSRVTHAMKLIHTLPLNTMNLKDVVRQTGVSRQWLDLRFKSLVGHTPSAEISRARLHYTRVMLHETTLTVREIALRCGFSNPENLTRFFRTLTGMTPNEFRRKGAPPPALLDHESPRHTA